MYLKLLDEYEKKGKPLGRTVHGELFEFALWLEQQAAQPAAEIGDGKPVCCCALYPSDITDHADFCPLYKQVT